MKTQKIAAQTAVGTCMPAAVRFRFNYGNEYIMAVGNAT